MNTDIRLLLSFQHHAKTKRLRKALGEIAELKFIYLLMYAAANKPDGVLSDMSDEDVELAVDWAGEDGAFVNTLLTVRYLERNTEGWLAIHDWADNNPWAATATGRKEKARKAAQARWSKKEDTPSKNEQCSEHNQALPQAPNSNAPSPSPSPSPTPNPVEHGASRNRSASKQGTRLPEGWEPSEALRVWTVAERPGLDVQRTLDSFTDYWRAKPGAAGRKSDWDATWRNWVRREDGTRRQSGNGTGFQAVRETANQRSERIENELLAKLRGAPNVGDGRTLEADA